MMGYVNSFNVTSHLNNNSSWQNSTTTRYQLFQKDSEWNWMKLHFSTLGHFDQNFSFCHKH